MKKLTIIMLIITGAIFFGIGGFSRSLMADTADVKIETRDTYLNIMTTNKMQYNIIKELSGNKHNVQYMFKDEKEMKKYKVNKDAIENISNMDLYFYSGNDFEPWINEFTSKLDKSNLGIHDLSRGIREEYYKSSDRENTIPYYWIGINEYKVLLYNAKSALQEKDPANREYYEKRYNDMLQDIEKIVDNFKENTKGLDKYTFVVKNENLKYFLDSIGLKYIVLGKDDTIEDYAHKNNIDLKDIVLIQSENNKDNEHVDYRRVTLELYNGNKTYKDIIQYNLEELNKLVDKK